MHVNVYVENGVTMAHDNGAAAWAFDADHWGVCGQGLTESEALEDLKVRFPPGALLRVAEQIQGDEKAFDRDRVPASQEEVERTIEILAAARTELLELLQNLTDSELDQSIPQGAGFAGWSTVRERAWHIADTESRYYLPALGLPSKRRSLDLLSELRESAEYIGTILRGMPRNLTRKTDGEVWTSTKLLRRLAWHERGELAVIRQMRGD